MGSEGSEGREEGGREGGGGREEGKEGGEGVTLCQCLQWNLSKTDTIETKINVLINQVSLF